MAVKPFRSSVATTTVSAWTPLITANGIQLKGGMLAYEIGTAVQNPVAVLLDGTAAAAGTIAYIPLGGSVTAVGARPAAVPFDFGEEGHWVSGAGGLGIRLDPSTVGPGTITGFFKGREQKRG